MYNVSVQSLYDNFFEPVYLFIDEKVSGDCVNDLIKKFLKRELLLTHDLISDLLHYCL